MSVAKRGLLLTLGFCLPSPLTQGVMAQASTSMGFEVGEPFPTMAFPSLEDGRPRSITDFRGMVPLRMLPSLGRSPSVPYCRSILLKTILPRGLN